MALTVKKVLRLKERGKYPDGLGLYLQINGNNRSWIFRYRRNGVQRWLGLGPVKIYDLEAARELARKLKQQIKEGLDPFAMRAAEKLRADRTKTFAQCAEGYLAAHGGRWKTTKALDDFTASLNTYVYPVCGNVPVTMIDRSLVMACIEPIWRTKTATASRVRGRIEDILHWATVHDFRAGENPARWEKHLEHCLPAISQIKQNNHHAALAYGAIPEFMAALRATDGIAARALELTILCATRTNETIGAKWDEINFAEKVWTVPATRMKAGERAHRIPLSDRAVEILQALQRMGGEWIFPSPQGGGPLSAKGMVRLLQRLGYSNEQATVHGFRSSFRDWAAETTATPNEVMEMALAHKIENRVEAAYRRGDLFVKRQILMQEWTAYCASTPAVVLPMRRSA